MTNPSKPTVAAALRWLGDSGLEIQLCLARYHGDTVRACARMSEQTWMNLEFRLDGAVYINFFLPAVDGLPAQSGEYAQHLGTWSNNE